MILNGQNAFTVTVRNVKVIWCNVWLVSVLLTYCTGCYCSRRSRTASDSQSGSARRPKSSDRQVDDGSVRKVDSENNAVFEQSERVSDYYCHHQRTSETQHSLLYL